MSRPPGAVWDGAGVRFTVRSRAASRVRLCLFEALEDPFESRRIDLERRGEEEWTVAVPGLAPGQLYGYRAEGPWRPRAGHRFNPAKLLVDPWARAITGEPRLSDALLDHRPGASSNTFSSADSAPAMPRSVVVDPAFDWQGVERPDTPWAETVIYECHVRGLTRLHPEVPPAHRGTYLGLAAEPVIEHLRGLGVTAVELMPVHQVASEQPLLARGLRNYWGYSTLGYFAPHAGYATGVTGEQVAELKTMVRELHRAGIEVILDVVYNHTAEGDERGPTLSLRGLDQRAYYRLDRSGRSADVTGCGNTLDAAKPATRALIRESLRYWADEVRVDGFRFDLATALGRAGDEVDPRGGLLAEIAADPVLAPLKLIAEPWDLGPGGYRLGGFPRQWGEWNDRFRDAARRFWLGHGGGGELARRLAGSRDLLPAAAKAAPRSIDFVTSHDGFTLADLVRYERKHNLANGEDGRDGDDHETSRNWGVEGPSGDPRIRALRERARRNLLVTLYLTRGVPMLSHGDELGRTQEGNNNPYCQDGELTWLRWEAPAAERAARRDLLAFVRRLAELRGRLAAAGDPELFRPDGRPLGPGAGGRSVTARYEGADEVFLVLLNGGEESRRFTPPAPGRAWRTLLATAGDPRREAGGGLALGGWALAVLAG